MENENANDDNEGMSTGKKVIAGAAIGVAVPAAVGVAKKLIGNDDDEQGADSGQSDSSQESGSKSGQSRSQGRSGTSATKRGSSSTSKRRSSSTSKRGSTSTSKRGSTSTSKRASGSGSSRSRSGSASRSRAKSSSSTQRSGSSSGGGSTRTKEQLYNQAKRLKIEGRSSMTKSQLERAISRAR